ncbi:PhaM family polyhydroxyalkanoate granule multifunctional regulatory protein [Variovorax boronicumulans]|uniref:PhaM family polyhydroxyalkanoate granule multifunctional regulatory protein n=1 Tax=Variovorax boronicumulans TaxID=436515 RepID=UPI001C5781F3
MSDANSPFAFSQFVPGFDFLKGLAGGTATGGGAAHGMPSLSSWVAPTLSVEELEKRIQELKTVQYWLEQNGHALKATIQALEVQKMTLSTLRGMNVQMEDLAKVFTRPAAEPVEAPAPAPAPEPAAAPLASSADADGAKPAPAAAPGVVDPLQWWNALTQQFQQIASTAMQDAAHAKMPGAMPVQKSAAKPAARTAAKTASRKTAPRKSAAKPSAAAAPRRARG